MDASKEDRFERIWEETKSSPFKPRAGTDGKHMPPPDRVAHALEYIAAKLGEISEKMDRLTDHSAASKD